MGCACISQNQRVIEQPTTYGTTSQILLQPEQENQKQSCMLEMQWETYFILRKETKI